MIEKSRERNKEVRIVPFLLVCALNGLLFESSISFKSDRQGFHLTRKIVPARAYARDFCKVTPFEMKKKQKKRRKRKGTNVNFVVG